MVTEATAAEYAVDASLSSSDANTHGRVLRVEGHPVFFGDPAAPLFGWLHRANGPLGLLICDPFGNESICANRTLRQLAERAASAGVPTMRFDYSGTGNSAGHDFEPNRVEAWVGSIRTAADELRAATGVTRICLLGIRLGAALAMRVAAERADITSLIAIAPVTSGKAYVRELRMLQRASEAKLDIEREDRSDTVETAGFTLTAQTQTELSRIDLASTARPAAARILILDRAELPGAQRLEQHLQAAGVAVERASVPGYTEMMLDSHESIVPQEMLAAVLSWLRQRKDEVAHAPPGESAPARTASADTQTMTLPLYKSVDPVVGEQPGTQVEETAVRFGPGAGLFGIVAAPAGRMSTAAPVGSRGVILLNSGAQHHVGPCRLYVALARHLARRGHVVLRMDIAGIGASPPRAGAEENIVYPPQATQDVLAAIKYLREHWHCQDVRASGLCSGAYHAFKAAAASLPLNGIVAINPLTFRWREGMSLKYPEHRVAADIVRYQLKVRSPASWMKLLRGHVDLWDSAQVLLRQGWTLAAAPVRNLARALGIELADDLPTELRTITRAGIDLHFVFALGDPGMELLRGRGGAAARKLRAAGKIHVTTIDGADHTFTDRTRRAQLINVLEQALCR
jgi:alpha/beta superfamily hydrolase